MLRRSPFFRFVVATLFVLVSAGIALAQSQILDAPRAAGTVGERYDGFAVVRSQENAATLAPLVDSINSQRRKVYADRAQKEHVPVDQIARVYAAEIFRSASAGTWFLKEDGQWIRK